MGELRRHLQISSPWPSYVNVYTVGLHCRRIYLQLFPRRSLMSNSKKCNTVPFSMKKEISTPCPSITNYFLCNNSSELYPMSLSCLTLSITNAIEFSKIQDGFHLDLRYFPALTSTFLWRFLFTPTIICDNIWLCNDLLLIIFS